MAEGQQLKAVTIKRGKDAPVAMSRGSATASDSKCYFVSENSNEVRMYDVEKDDWFVLRQCPYNNSALAVVNGLLTAIGGERGEPSTAAYEFTNSLYSLSNRRWIEKLPPMKMDPALGVNSKKNNPAVVQSGSSLIVIGGRTESMPQSRVDILNTETLEWSDAAELPRTSSVPSAAICGDEIYVMNGDGWGRWVWQCFLDELMGVSKPAGSVWSEVANAPHEYATCASLCGQLVAIGDRNDSPSIKAYDSAKDSWYEIGKLAIGCSCPLIAQLSEDTLVVVGGKRRGYRNVLLTQIVTGVL